MAILALTSRRFEETRLVAPGVQQTDATLLLPTPEMSLGEVERMESTEHQVNSTVSGTTALLRDLNGRWQPIEARSGEIRGVGAAERVEEETVRRPNLNGALRYQDKIVTSAPPDRTARNGW